LERWALELERIADSPRRIDWELHSGELNNVEQLPLNSLNACNRIDGTFDRTVVAPVREPGHLAQPFYGRSCMSGF
jgi:hypothetical protein